MSIVDPFAGLKKAKEDYKVYDSHYEKIGKVDDLLVDDRDEVLYVGVKMGLFGTNSTIIPTEIVRVNDKRQLIEVSEPADTIKHAPHFGHGNDLTPELENHVRSYYGLEGLRATPEHTGGYSTSGDDSRFAPDPRVDMVPGERAGAQERPAPSSPAPSSSHPVDIPLDDDVPEFEPARRTEQPIERPTERPAARRTEQPTERPTVRRTEQPIERSTEKPAARRTPRSTEESEGRWDTEDAGRVKVHRLRR